MTVKHTQPALKRAIELSTILLFLLFLISACQYRQKNELMEQKRKVADSLVALHRDMDSLNVLLKDFSQKGDKIGMIAAYQKMGKTYREESRFTEAIACHQKEVSCAQDLQDTLAIIDGMNNIATNFRRLGILDDALSYHYQALLYCETYSDKQSKMSKKNRVITLNGIGNILLTLNNYETADSIFRQALKGEHELGSALGEAINYANLGSIFEMTGHLDSARVYYALSMAYNQKAKSVLGISLCYTHFGNLDEAAHQWDKAIAEYQAAYAIMAKRSDSWHCLEAALSLARVYLKKGDLATAKKYLDKSKKTAESIHSLEHISQVYHLYYLMYKQQRNCKAALDCYVKSETYEDSISNQKKLNSMQNLRISYEREHQQKELSTMQHNYEIEQHVKDTISLVLLFIVLLSVAAIIFLWYTLRVRAHTQRTIRHMADVRASFFTNITHEFRTPLTVILGFSKQLEEGKLLPGQTIDNIGKMISRQGNNLLQLINQLLDISKVKSAIGEPDWRKGNVIAYLRMIIESYAASARQKKIELLFLPAENIVEMDFIPDYIVKIMRNLISNALKYTPAYGRIIVDSKKDTSALTINVADTGQGIEPKDVPHIFDAFYQGENNSANIGTGVGLSLVWQLVKAMNGHISVSSDMGKGTVFTFNLPLVHGESKWLPFGEKEMKEEQGETVTSAEVAALPTGLQASEAVPTILIVEDNADISYYIGAQLQERYNLYYAQNGEEGLERAKEVMPDLIITDLMMLNIDGLELCREIRASEILNHIPIIIITAKSSEEDRIKGLAAGADAYLFKPFNTEELNIRVEKLLDSRRMLREKYSKALQTGTEENVQLSPNEQAFLNKLVDVVYSQIATEKSDVETIASMMCMSRSQLNRKILSITGENTTTYVIQIKLSKAKRLLDSPKDIPIGDIAMQCGFEDGAYFSRIFKQMFNMTPSQYRKRIKS